MFTWPLLFARPFKPRALVPLPPRIPTALGLHHDDGLALRAHTERALALSDPEELELEQGLRRGRSGALWSAPQAAAALGGARDVRELLQVTKEILPVQEDAGAIGLTKPQTWRELLQEHPPDNALPEAES